MRPGAWPWGVAARGSRRTRRPSICTKKRRKTHLRQFEGHLLDNTPGPVAKFTTQISHLCSNFRARLRGTDLGPGRGEARRGARGRAAVALEKPPATGATLSRSTRQPRATILHMQTRTKYRLFANQASILPPGLKDHLPGVTRRRLRLKRGLCGEGSDLRRLRPPVDAEVRRAGGAGRRRGRGGRWFVDVTSWTM